MISNEALQEFKIIWKEEFGEMLPDDIALDEAITLLNIANHIYKPIRKDWVNSADTNNLS